MLNDNIEYYIKNRPPFLFVDRIIELEIGKRVVALKNFSINEAFFKGHFSDNPNVPGAIQLEVMLETFIVTFLSEPNLRGMETADSCVDNLKFLRPIKPGDSLIVEANLLSFKRGIAKGTAIGKVGEKKVCSCDMTVCIPEILNKFSPMRHN